METKLTISKESLNRFKSLYTDRNVLDIVQDFNGTKFVRVNKATAKRFFSRGVAIWLQSNKLGFCSMWHDPAIIHQAGGEFEKQLNQYIYYNCNAEIGRYPHYYINKETYLNQ